jgi:hypothetical protein
MTVMMLCGTCDGRRIVERPSVVFPGSTINEKCPTCGGMGNLPDHTGRDNLTAVLAAAGVDADTVLAVLSAERAELFAWLREIDVVSPSEWALVEHHDTDGWGHAGPTLWSARKVGSDYAGDLRLFRVRAR